MSGENIEDFGVTPGVEAVSSSDRGSVVPREQSGRAVATDSHRVERGRFAPGNPFGRRFAEGNSAARTHGLYAASTERGDLPADLRQPIAEFREDVVSDLGGASAMSAIKRGYVQRLCDVEVAVRLLQNDLVARGVFTPKGRVRSTYSRLLETIDRWDRLAQRLGTERRARPVTFEAAIAAEPEAR